MAAKPLVKANKERQNQMLFFTQVKKGERRHETFQREQLLTLMASNSVRPDLSVPASVINMATPLRPLSMAACERKGTRHTHFHIKLHFYIFAIFHSHTFLDKL